MMSWTEVALAVVALVGFLGALPQLWGSNWKRIWQYHCRGIVSWDAVHRSILSLMDKLRRDRFDPTMVVGIGRGGILCSGLLCSELTGEGLVRNAQERGPLLSRKIKLHAVNSTVHMKQRLPEGIRGHGSELVAKVDRIDVDDVGVDVVESDKVLLLVAQTFTGTTLEKATSSLVARGVPRNNIRSASVFWHRHRNIETVHVPDVFGRTLSISKTMPWKNRGVTTDRY